MAAPTLTATYPADSDTGIPVGISLEFLFDRGIDLETAKSAVVVYGADYDQTSGPDQASWTNASTIDNPYYLRSPGFQGLVPLNYRLIYWDLVNDLEVDPGTITAETDETSGSYGHKLIVTPQEQLAADTTFNVFVMGDPDDVDNGISSRTVFDVEPDGANVGTDGEVYVYGGYTRNSADTVVIEITTSGDIGDAKYRWYYQSAGVGSAITGRITSRRYRRLEDGIQVRFSGSGFVSGDVYTFNVEPIERMADNVQLSFTTGDGSYVDAPDSPSTPATSEPPTSVLPAVGEEAGASYLEIVETTPDNRQINVSLDTNTIEIVFTEDIDPATVTDDAITLTMMSASGEYSNTSPPTELSKTLSVSGNVLTITF